MIDLSPIEIVNRLDQDIIGQHEVVTVRLKTLRLGSVFDVQSPIMNERKFGEPLRRFAKEAGRNIRVIELGSCGGKQRKQIFGRSARSGADFQNSQSAPRRRVGQGLLDD